MQLLFNIKIHFLFYLSQFHIFFTTIPTQFFIQIQMSNLVNIFKFKQDLWLASGEAFNLNTSSSCVHRTNMESDSQISAFQSEMHGLLLLGRYIAFSAFI